MSDADRAQGSNEARVSLLAISQEWMRIGCIGFGGPPVHIALLRRLCVDDRGWIDAQEFEDGVATVNLLPGPASTQLAIWCAWRLAGPIGAILGGICFIVPGLALILALSAVFLARNPPAWVLGAAAGAGATVPVVAISAALSFVPASWTRIGRERAQRARWVVYALSGGIAAATVGSYLVLVLIACGSSEIVLRRVTQNRDGRAHHALGIASISHVVALGGLASVAWVALKIGALSYGGGFVIIPLMQHDAVSTYHWMTGSQFLNAVALGQVTPGPVVQTVAVVGYAADGLAGGLIAALVAFAPSFCFILFGARHFDRLRANETIQAFLRGAGPAVVGAIAGSAVPLALALTHLWQLAILLLAAIWLIALRRGVVPAVLGAGTAGALAALLGAPLSH